MVEFIAKFIFFIGDNPYTLFRNVVLLFSPIKRSMGEIAYHTIFIYIKYILSMNIRLVD